MKNRILVSACLLGQPVRYDGKAKTLLHPLLQQWQEEGRLVVVCPELAGGMPVPRPPAEIGARQDGRDVLQGEARVIDTSGADVTDEFVAGARIALNVAQTQGCRFALLMEGSPSCGSQMIYDGSFSGQKHAGAGVTAALLRQNGIQVFSQNTIEALRIALQRAG
ncbi:purine nucleoside phosphorylase [Gluconobacter japonicus]|nr:purine nucleoside phosphorylase [Gluconobacter japonicus]